MYFVKSPANTCVDVSACQRKLSAKIPERFDTITNARVGVRFLCLGCLPTLGKVAISASEQSSASTCFWEAVLWFALLILIPMLHCVKILFLWARRQLCVFRVFVAR